MKKAYTIDQQIARLKANGMAFDDEEKAKEILLDVGYYRLGFYSFPYEIKFPCLEHRDHKLKAGTTFKSVYDLYEFDTKLRRLLLNALDRIEVNIRTKLIYNISLRYIDDPAQLKTAPVFAVLLNMTSHWQQQSSKSEHSETMTAYLEHFLKPS